MDRLSLTIFDSGQRELINAGFQNPHRPAWYLATQDVIVPKEHFFASVCEHVSRACDSHGRPELVIFEPGVGLGGFFQYLLTQTRIPERLDLRLVGADVSSEMIRGCQAVLRSIEPRSSWKRVVIHLHVGTNLLALDSLDAQLGLDSTQVDIVLASQVEHYFPNDPMSPLAAKLSAAGLPATTKHEFRTWAYRHLCEGGFYFSLDDYSSGDDVLDAARTQAWDAYVVQRFSDEAFLTGIAGRFPAIAASLRRTYNRLLGSAVLLRKAASARQRRRSVCREETGTLQSAVADLEQMFGPSAVGVQSHALCESHALFYLLSAQRQPKRAEAESRTPMKPEQTMSEAGSWQKAAPL